MGTVEVRMPTFERPALLRRALQSLIAQTYPDWICRVFDDAATHSAGAVCAEFGDPRIRYEPNRVNLGLCANVNRCFTVEPEPRVRYLCILEDDNYFLPRNLADNIRRMEDNGVDIVLRNAAVELSGASLTDSVLRAEAFYDKSYREGVIPKWDLWASLFYTAGVTHIGVFWRAGRGLDLSTISMSNDPIFQERLRTLRVERPAYIAMEPLVIWRENAAETYRTASRARWTLYRSQVLAAGRERALYSALFRLLEQQGLKHLVWRNWIGEIGAYGERVLRRNGLPTPKPSKLTLRARWTLFAKLTLVRFAGLFLKEPVTYRLTDRGIETMANHITEGATGAS